MIAFTATWTMRSRGHARPVLLEHFSALGDNRVPAQESVAAGRLRDDRVL